MQTLTKDARDRRAAVVARSRPKAKHMAAWPWWQLSWGGRPRLRVQAATKSEARARFKDMIRPHVLVSADPELRGVVERV